MIIFILPGGAAEVVDYIVARWTLKGFSVVRQEREDGSIVLASHELPGPTPHPA
jgi:hypothetical protein